MKCPRCKNKGFVPTEEIKYPLFNMGNKEKYDSVDYRRYICMQCGYKFLTSESYERPVCGNNPEHENLFEEQE